MAIFVERNQFVLAGPIYLALGVFPWAVFPGAALLLGALLFMLEPKRETGLVA
jgi:hypothetical protein